MNTTLEQMTDMQVDKAVRIGGTQYDRRRRVTDDAINKMKLLHSKGVDIETIAKVVGCHVRTVRYYLDPSYRAYRIEHAHYGQQKVSRDRLWKNTLADRAAYKRKLVSRGYIEVE